MSHKVLENQMRSIINNLPTGTEFQLNEIIDNPPAQLGRTLYEDVQNKKIENVICITQANDTIQKYRKL
ncbi:MAG: hypothetical protein NC321_05825 [Clostridium sp.]|nr:hypothetical protein [Clostridium sp.]